jgi:hypothetical protein
MNNKSILRLLTPCKPFFLKPTKGKEKALHTEGLPNFYVIIHNAANLHPEPI